MLKMLCLPFLASEASKNLTHSRLINLSLQVSWQHHFQFRGNWGTEKVPGVAFQEIAPGQIPIIMGARWRAWFPSEHLSKNQIFTSDQHPVALTMTLADGFSKKFLWSSVHCLSGGRELLKNLILFVGAGHFSKFFLKWPGQACRLKSEQNHFA